MGQYWRSPRSPDCQQRSYGTISSVTRVASGISVTSVKTRDKRCHRKGSPKARSCWQWRCLSSVSMSYIGGYIGRFSDRLGTPGWRAWLSARTATTNMMALDTLAALMAQLCGDGGRPHGCPPLILIRPLTCGSPVSADRMAWHCRGSNETSRNSSNGVLMRHTRSCLSSRPLFYIKKPIHITYY